jgi:hypothetical protein
MRSPQRTNDGTPVRGTPWFTAQTTATQNLSTLPYWKPSCERSRTRLELRMSGYSGGGPRISRMEGDAIKELDRMVRFERRGLGCSLWDWWCVLVAEMRSRGIGVVLEELPEDLRYIPRYWCDKKLELRAADCSTNEINMDQFESDLRDALGKLPITKAEAEARQKDRRILRSDSEQAELLRNRNIATERIRRDTIG